jgi:hypothetical protein
LEPEDEEEEKEEDDEEDDEEKEEEEASLGLTLMIDWLDLNKRGA